MSCVFLSAIDFIPPKYVMFQDRRQRLPVKGSAEEGSSSKLEDPVRKLRLLLRMG